jgi:hypothetical protein
MNVTTQPTESPRPTFADLCENAVFVVYTRSVDEHTVCLKKNSTQLIVLSSGEILPASPSMTVHRVVHLHATYTA